MVRSARVVISGQPYHVTHRGNNRQTTFRDEIDFERYLALLKVYANTFHLRLLSYCFMSNHVHLVSIPEDVSALGKTMGVTHLRYAQQYNKRYHLSGHLWQGRFYSCVLDDVHLLRALRYVECNPVRAGIMRFPGEYPWSSAAAHLTGHDPTGLLDMQWWHEHIAADSWRAFLLQTEEERWGEQLRNATVTGRPFGDDAYLRHIEHQTGRTLTPNPIGRPKRR